MKLKAFFDAVRAKPFGGPLSTASVNGCEAIIEAFQNYGDADLNKLAYCLATAFHESGRFKYTHEVWGPTAAQKRYEGRADLGNTQAGDGKRYMGRGYCQITGRRNYTDWTKRTGVDLVGSPDLVTEPAMAARILVQGSLLGSFTGKKLGDYIGGGKVDFTNARRVINGIDKAPLIAGYAESFVAALRAADVVSESSPANTLPPAASIERLDALEARIEAVARFVGMQAE